MTRLPFPNSSEAQSPASSGAPFSSSGIPEALEDFGGLPLRGGADENQAGVV